LTPESRERSFSRENHLLKLAVGTAAEAVAHREPEISVEFSEAVIPDAGPVFEFSVPDTRKLSFARGSRFSGPKGS
jgi:hypothetical protein